MSFGNSSGLIGLKPINTFQLPSTVEEQQPGLVVSAVDPYWGGGEFIYCRANGTIAAQAMVVITPVLSGTAWRYNATEVPNTANLGRVVGIACTQAAAGEFIWVQVAGVAPVRSTASVAADTAVGITAAGQIGAITAGKQIVKARCVAPATTTVVKPAVGNNGSLRITISGSDGWFIGAFLSGAGIAAGTTIVEIDPSGTIVTLSAATTAAVAGNVTATYNNGAVFFNVLHINRPFAQGQIT